jgi:hypothetical protein
MTTKAFPIRIGLAIGCALAAIHCGAEIGDGTPDPNNNGNQGLGCSACTGESICVENVCEDAFPRFYTITVQEVLFPSMKPDGSCWDEPGCGAPDPEIEIKLNDDKVGELETDDDMFTATFVDAIELQLIAGSKLELQLDDEDLVEDEEVLSCEFDPLTAEKIRAGDVGCSNGGATIQARITVRGGSNP